MSILNELRIDDQVRIVDAKIVDTIVFDDHVYACLDTESDTDPWLLIKQATWPLDWPPQKGDRVKMAMPTILAVAPRQHVPTDGGIEGKHECQ